MEIEAIEAFINMNILIILIKNGDKTMNFQEAIRLLADGKKIYRDCWQEDSYWYLGSEGIILWTDGTPAKIHLNQINANDWQIFEERLRTMTIQNKDGTDKEILKLTNEDYERVIKYGRSLAKEIIKGEDKLSCLFG